MSGRKTQNQRFIMFTSLYAVHRKLKKAAYDYTTNFFQQLPTSREQWIFIKNRINSNSQIKKFAN